MAREAVDTTPNGHLDQAVRLINLGEKLQYRHKYTRRRADLEEAIRVTQHALDSTPEDHPLREAWLCNQRTMLRDIQTCDTCRGIHPSGSEYIPFIPIRCARPEAPLDPPLLEGASEGFWEESAEHVFKGGGDIIRLIRCASSLQYAQSMRGFKSRGLGIQD